MSQYWNIRTNLDDTSNALGNYDSDAYGQISVLLNKYVLKEEGKGLSSNDFTDEDKSKLDSIQSNAEENVLETISVNNGEPIHADSNKNINILVPTKTSELLNDKGFAVLENESMYDDYRDSYVGKAKTAFETETDISIGLGSEATFNSVAIGKQSISKCGVAIGENSSVSCCGIAIGKSSCTNKGISIGEGATSCVDTIAIGKNTCADLTYGVNINNVAKYNKLNCIWEMKTSNSVTSDCTTVAITNLNGTDLTELDNLISNLSDECRLRIYNDNLLQGSIDDITSRINTIDSYIPNQTSAQNQLADKDFVNSSIQTSTANFRGNWATWSDVPTDANDYPVDYVGNKTPTVNDYMSVRNASDYTLETLSGTWRFKYTGNWSVNGKNGWIPEYQVNEEPFTSEQLYAINSGITCDKVANYDAHLTNCSNPHNVTKTQIGLSNVDNTADNTKCVKDTVCFNGCTYACAKADIRNGLTNCVGTVTNIDVYCDTNLVCSICTSGSLCLGTNAFNSTAFTTCKGTVTSVKLGSCSCSPDASGVVCLPSYPPDLSSCSGLDCVGTVTSVKVGTTSYNPTSGVISLPSYPTVNNKTITIQKNNTSVGTFTLNQSTDCSINISVPTKVSDLTNDSGFTDCVGTVTILDKAKANSNTPVALCTDTNSVGKSSGCSLNFNTCTGVLSMTTLNAINVCGSSYVRTPILMSNATSGVSASNNVTIRVCRTNESCTLTCTNFVFCGSTGYMHGNVCGNICGQSCCAKFINRTAITTGICPILLAGGCNTNTAGGVCVADVSKCQLTYDIANGCLLGYASRFTGWVTTPSVYSVANASVIASTEYPFSIYARKTDASKNITQSQFTFCSNGSFNTTIACATSHIESPLFTSLPASGVSCCVDTVIRSCKTNSSCTPTCYNWTFCGCNGYMYGNVSGTLSGTATRANCLCITQAITNTDYYFAMTCSSTRGCVALYNANGFYMAFTRGTTSAEGKTIVNLGNTSKSNVDDNQTGELVFYNKCGCNAKLCYKTDSTSNVTLTLPNVTGTLTTCTGTVTSITLCCNGSCITQITSSGTLNICDSKTLHTQVCSCCDRNILFSAYGLATGTCCGVYFSDGTNGCPFTYNACIGELKTPKITIGKGCATMQYNSTTQSIEFVFN